MGKLRDAKLIFDPTLFWDAEDIDTGRHADYIIARVLDFGDKKDVKRLREIYSDDELINHKDKEGAFADNEGDVSGSALRKSSGSDRQNCRSDQ